jgi:ABC-type Fe3+/spermidine/putrescine transport system ATPase subunit
MSRTFLEVRNLVKVFGKLTAVDNVSFKVEQGEVVTLLGPSGCGKTTTLRMVAGFEKPNAGEVEIAGRVVVATNRRINVPPEKRDIGMVFQSYAIWPHMTVFENVAFPLNVRHANRQEIKRRVRETLELVGLANFSDRPAILLSGGQQQRVSLARALVYSPSILLLDEPLSNLDAKLREQMRIEIKRLQQQLGFTVLFVTHDQIEAMSLSTRLALMNQGRIEQLGGPQEVYENPQTPFVEDFLGRILRFRGKVIEKQQGFDVVEFDGLKNVQVRIPESADGAEVGKRVLVAIRPEDARIERNDSAKRDNVIPCDVENILHLGRELELVLRVGGRVCTLTVPRERGTELCRSIGLHLPPEHLRVWVTDSELENEIETGLQPSSIPEQR